jgi:hypothetical protein
MSRYPEQRKAIMVLWLGTTISLLLLVIMYVVITSRLDIYRSLSLGLPRADAIRILRRNEIGCGVVSLAAPGEEIRECWFWDPWRTYGIVFEPGGGGRIITKGYSYRNLSLLVSGATRPPKE